MAIRRGTHTSNFTVLPNELINDNSMSLEARGMLILLLSKPEGWQISNAGLVAMLESGPHPVGRDLVARMLREIVAAGYMVRSQERMPDGTLGPTDYEVHSIRYGWDAVQPLTAKPSTVQPLTVNPLQESNVLEPKKELSLRKNRGEPQVAKIDLTASGWRNIAPETRLQWKSAYPAISIDQELEKARAWLNANPSNRKSNYAKFLVNWFCRAQDKAPRVAAPQQRSDGTFRVAL